MDIHQPVCRAGPYQRHGVAPSDTDAEDGCGLTQGHRPSGQQPVEGVEDIIGRMRDKRDGDENTVEVQVRASQDVGFNGAFSPLGLVPTEMAAGRNSAGLCARHGANNPPAWTPSAE